MKAWENVLNAIYKTNEASLRSLWYSPCSESQSLENCFQCAAAQLTQPDRGEDCDLKKCLIIILES